MHEIYRRQTKIRSCLPAACLAALLLTGCSGGTEAASGTSASHRFALAEKDGVRTAVNAGGPVYHGELFHYEKVLELRSNEANPDSILHGARSFTMDTDGVFYVADTRRHRIAVFDAEGQYRRSIGQEGDGPGDLRNPTQVELIDGILHVPGIRGRKTTLFRTDGSLVDILSTNAPGPRPTALYRSPDGELVVLSRRFERGEQLQGFAARATVVAPSGEAVAEMETDVVPAWRLVDRELDDRQFRFPVPIHYAARAQAFYRPGGEILLSDGREPVLRWYGLDGQLRRQVRIELDPELVSNQERQAMATLLEQMILEAPERSSERERVIGKPELRLQRDNLQFAEPKAAWTSVVVDDRGYAWLMRSDPVVLNYYANRTLEFRVIDPEGVYLGETTWPPLLQGQVVRGRLLAVVFNEETLEEVPTVFRIEPAIAGVAY
ncbi:MAG: 6-bladed beta-propeller [Acidobacteriota bacterium]